MISPQIRGDQISFRVDPKSCQAVYKLLVLFNFLTFFFSGAIFGVLILTYDF